MRTSVAGSAGSNRGLGGSGADRVGAGDAAEPGTLGVCVVIVGRLTTRRLPEEPPLDQGRPEDEDEQDHATAAA